MELNVITFWRLFKKDLPVRFLPIDYSFDCSKKFVIIVFLDETQKYEVKLNKFYSFFYGNMLKIH